MRTRPTGFSAVAACLVAVLTSPLGTSAQALAARIDSLLTSDGVSGSVVVTQRGETVLSAGYGMANRELGVPNTASTKHRIGSITKQFTSMAVLILQDRGRLSVTDRVGEHVQTVPPTWQDLTIHQLLTHTSGLVHSWAVPGFAEVAMKPITLDETLELFFDEPLRFEPGAQYEYSGVGYFLLAKIVEAASGQDFDDFLDAEIFGPLGMVDTGGDHPEVVLEGRSSDYVRNADGVIRNAPPLYAPILTGGGHLYSTVEDLSKWDRALAERLLISADGYAALFRPEQEGYAYGWTVGQFRGRPSLAHAGSVPGFAGIMLRLPADDVCVVVLTNMTPGRVGQVARAVAALVLEAGGA